MKIGFLAEQVGPSRFHRLYVNHFEQAGHETLCIGNLQIEQRDAIQQLINCAVVLADISFAPDSVRSLAIARELKSRQVPVVLLEGVPDIAVNKQEGKSLSEDEPDLLDHVVASTPASRDQAERSGIGATFLGYPLHWQGLLQWMKQGEEFRSHMRLHRWKGKKEEHAPLDSNKMFVYLPGIKTRSQEDLLIERIITAAEDMAKNDVGFSSENLVFHVRPHPGERNPALHTPDQIQTSDTWRRKRLQGIWTLDEEHPTEGISRVENAHIVGASNVTVFSGGPTESLIAMIRRKCSIFIVDGHPNFGSTWEPVRVGAMVPATMDTVHEAMERALHSSGVRKSTLEAQEQNYPVMKNENAAQKLLTFLEERYQD